MNIKYFFEHKSILIKVYYYIRCLYGIHLTRVLFILNHDGFLFISTFASDKESISSLVYTHNPNQRQCHQIQISCLFEFYPINRTRFECFWILRGHIIITNKKMYIRIVECERSVHFIGTDKLIYCRFNKSINTIYKKRTRFYHR